MPDNKPQNLSEERNQGHYVKDHDPAMLEYKSPPPPPPPQPLPSEE